jgi:hypothetical protein
MFPQNASSVQDAAINGVHLKSGRRWIEMPVAVGEKLSTAAPLTPKVESDPVDNGGGDMVLSRRPFGQSEP